MSRKASNIEQRPPTAAKKRRAAAREATLVATRELITESGFQGAQVSIIALRAGVSVGSIYQHFPSRADLLAETYARVVTHELDVLCELADATDGGAEAQIRSVVATFCRRALRAGRLSQALLVEPVEPEVDEHRLIYRDRFKALFARLIREGVEAGELRVQHADIAAAAVFGIMVETLLRRSAAPETTTLPPETRIAEIVRLCLAVVGVPTDVSTTGDVASQA